MQPQPQLCITYVSQLRTNTTCELRFNTGPVGLEPALCRFTVVSLNFLLELSAPELLRSSTDLLNSHYIISDTQKINSGRKQSNYWGGGFHYPRYPTYSLLCVTVSQHSKFSPIHQNETPTQRNFQERISQNDILMLLKLISFYLLQMCADKNKPEDTTCFSLQTLVHFLKSHHYRLTSKKKHSWQGLLLFLRQCVHVRSASRREKDPSMCG